MRKTINVKWLKKLLACRAGIQWFEDQKTNDTAKILRSLIKQKRLDWAWWLSLNLLTQRQYDKYHNKGWENCKTRKIEAKLFYDILGIKQVRWPK